MLHEPYRAWCQACVSGRGRVEYHYSRDHSDDAVAIVSIDYGYLSKRVQEGEELSGDKDGENDEDGNKCSPILCGISSVDRWRLGIMMPCKGVEHPYCWQKLASELGRVGVRKMFVRSDDENAILALIRKAAVHPRSETGIEAVPDPVRVGDSDANGAAEGAVKEVKAKCRTVAAATEQLLQIKLAANFVLLPFLVLYACRTINTGRRGTDGKTAYELRYGKAWRGKWAIFGEKVMWLPAGPRASHLDTGYKEGVFLGVIEGSNNYYIGVPGKVERARAIKLLDKGQNADKDLFASVRGTPWQLDPSVNTPGRLLEPRAHAGPVVVEEALPDERTEAELMQAARRVYLRRDVELQKYGYSDNCDGCAHARADRSPRPHAVECRLRIVKAMRNDPEGRARLEAATKRGNSDGGLQKRAVRLKREPLPMAQSGGASSSSSVPSPEDLVEIAPGVTMRRAEAECAGYVNTRAEAVPTTTSSTTTTTTTTGENTRGRSSDTHGRLSENTHARRHGRAGRANCGRGGKHI